MIRCLGPDAAQPLQITVQDWARDPLVCTGTDRDGAGAHPEIGPAILRHAHLGGRLHTGVSETSTRSPGLIEGVLHAGQTTIQTLLALCPPSRFFLRQISLGGCSTLLNMGADSPLSGQPRSCTATFGQTSFAIRHRWR